MARGTEYRRGQDLHLGIWLTLLNSAGKKKSSGIRGVKKSAKQVRFADLLPGG